MRHGVEIERHNAEIQEIFEALRQLIEEPLPTRRKIGFATKSGEEQ
jgi:hypothetical protein